MKRFIVIIYVSAILLFAGFARAEFRHTFLPINEALFDQASQSLYVKGFVFDTCLQNIKPEVSEITKDTFSLDVVAISGSGVCMPVPNGEYELSIDLRSLNSENSLKNVSKLVVGSEEFAINLSGSSQFEFSTENLKGKIVYLNRELGFGIKLRNGQIIALNNPSLNLMSHLNKNVMVYGHRLNHYLPILDVNDPFDSPIDGLLSHEQFYVTGISPALL